MSAIPSNAFSSVSLPALRTYPDTHDSHTLHPMPALLEYRGEADPDAEFIPKTIAGFSGGFLVMSACLVAMAMLLLKKGTTPDEANSMLLTLICFIIGIAGVASSLLLVGLKVRADRSEECLYARHWLNSLTTGAGFALLIAIPGFLMQHGLVIDRFVAAAIWMTLMIYPAIAAKWMIQPHPHLQA